MEGFDMNRMYSSWQTPHTSARLSPAPSPTLPRVIVVEGRVGGNSTGVHCAPRVIRGVGGNAEAGFWVKISCVTYSPPRTASAPPLPPALALPRAHLALPRGQTKNENSNFKIFGY